MTADRLSQAVPLKRTSLTFSIPNQVSLPPSLSLTTRKDMARKVSFVILSLFTLLLLIPENQATITEAPSPQPQATPGNLPAYGAREGSLKPQECGPRCKERCSKTAYKKPCMFFCQKCCAKCLCVPPGTYGNKQLCPCYNNWKTKRGGPKCP